MAEEITFIINTPAHKRWWLPDGHHMCNSVIYGNDCRMSVIRAEDHNTIISFTVKLDNPQWQDLCWSFAEKAAKKYPRPIRHKSNEYQHNPSARKAW